jgi:assimilatory nitrate reductase catalytic subunit
LLVCHCHRIGDRTIRECIRNGARSIDEVSRSCGAGMACGGCRPAIGALVGDAASERRCAEEAPRSGLLTIGAHLSLSAASH